jgi:hypothetical protein
MSFAGQYLSRHAVTDKIHNSPKKDLRFIVVLPSFDEPRLIHTLQSLWSCRRPASAVEIVVVVNSPENAASGIIAANKKTIKEASAWVNTHNDPGFTSYVLDEPRLPSHEAGPGLARKIGMDQAVLRFNSLGRPDGVIISFDADTLCRPDYLKEIEKCFDQYPGTKSCSVYFEHPLAGEEFPDIVYRAIAEYELHMRYYISALRRTKFPYSFHTIGSCFCVTAETYVGQAGMNKRKAGEDFYFLQKVIPLGNFREVNTTCVYPSPRPSGRVPFGTGAVIKKFTDGKISEVETYHPGSFVPLQELFSDPAGWYRLTSSGIAEEFKKLPEVIREFTGAEFPRKIEEINNNSSAPDRFVKRFYQWFNMFRVLKFLNYVHKKHFSRVPVRFAAAEFLENSGQGSFRNMSTAELLEYFRKLQREEIYSGLNTGD